MNKQSMIDYLDGALGEGTYHSTSKGDQYSYQCPMCDDHKERFFVNIDREVVHCHNCDYSASLITFLSDYNHITWRDALTLFRQHRGYERELPESLEQEIYQKLVANKIEVVQQKFIYPLPEEFILIEEGKGKAGNQAWKYLKSRGITMDDCSRYYIGYCAEGDYANRIIMPDFENGELIYWQARTWLPAPKNVHAKKFFRKSLNPSLTKEQVEEGVIAVDKSEVISNMDFILDNGIAVVCEGKMDAYSLKDYGACTHGKVMSDAQFMKLVSNKDKIDTVYVMYDGDAVKYTLSTAERLSKYFEDVYVCILPDGEDPNSLGTKKCIEYLSNAIKYSPMIGIKLRLKGIV